MFWGLILREHFQPSFLIFFQKDYQLSIRNVFKFIKELILIALIFLVIQLKKNHLYASIIDIDRILRKNLTHVYAK